MCVCVYVGGKGGKRGGGGRGGGKKKVKWAKKNKIYEIDNLIFAPDKEVKRSILCNNNQKTQLFTKPTYNQAPPPPIFVKIVVY